MEYLLAVALAPFYGVFSFKKARPYYSRKARVDKGRLYGDRLLEHDSNITVLTSNMHEHYLVRMLVLLLAAYKILPPVVLQSSIAATQDSLY